MNGRKRSDASIDRLSQIDHACVSVDAKARAERLRQVSESIEDGGGSRRRRQTRKPPRARRQIATQIDRPPPLAVVESAASARVVLAQRAERQSVQIDSGVVPRTALLLNCEHVSATQTYYWGRNLRKADTVDARRWAGGRDRRAKGFCRA